MLIEINNPVDHQTRVITEASVATIAGRAQESPHGAGRVIVVEAKRSPARRAATDRTKPPCSSNNRLDPSRDNPYNFSRKPRPRYRTQARQMRMRRPFLSTIHFVLASSNGCPFFAMGPLPPVATLRIVRAIICDHSVRSFEPLRPTRGAGMRAEVRHCEVGILRRHGTSGAPPEKRAQQTSTQTQRTP